MLNSDLNGLWEQCRHNKTLHLLILIGICVFLYSMLNNYMKKKNEFNNIVILKNMINANTCDNNNTIQRMDEALIRDTIQLPNRNPKLLTSSMVYPEPSKPSDEDIRKTRMDVLNMFYDSFDDDLTSIKARPQNLYIIP